MRATRSARLVFSWWGQVGWILLIDQGVMIDGQRALNPMQEASAASYSRTVSCLGLLILRSSTLTQLTRPI